MVSSDATAGLLHPDEADGRHVVRRRRVLYGTTTAVLVALALLTVLDAWAPVWGVDTAEVEDRAADGTLLRVGYPELTRPALASPFSVEVHRADGFVEPIEIAVSRPWIEVWDENGFYPTPSTERGDDDWVIWEFEPPDGEVFRFFYDARLEPARQTGVEGAVELREDGAPIARVSFTTAVRP